MSSGGQTARNLHAEETHGVKSLRKIRLFMSDKKDRVSDNEQIKEDESAQKIQTGASQCAMPYGNRFPVPAVVVPLRCSALCAG